MYFFLGEGGGEYTIPSNYKYTSIHCKKIYVTFYITDKPHALCLYKPKCQIPRKAPVCGAWLHHRRQVWPETHSFCCSMSGHRALGTPASEVRSKLIVDGDLQIDWIIAFHYFGCTFIDINDGIFYCFVLRGATPNDVTKRKVTPLHFACYAGRVKNAEILLEKAKLSKKIVLYINRYISAWTCIRMNCFKNNFRKI